MGGGEQKFLHGSGLLGPCEAGNRPHGLNNRPMFAGLEEDEKEKEDDEKEALGAQRRGEVE